MTELKVDIKGGDAIVKKLNDQQNTKVPLKNFVEVTNRVIVTKAQAFSPEDTGLLRASWVGNINANARPMTAVVTNKVKYALPLEVSGFKPKRRGSIPFLKPAIEYFLQNKDKYFNALLKGIEKRYEK